MLPKLGAILKAGQSWTCHLANWDRVEGFECTHSLKFRPAEVFYGSTNCSVTHVSRHLTAPCFPRLPPFQHLKFPISLYVIPKKKESESEFLPNWQLPSHPMQCMVCRILCPAASSFGFSCPKHRRWWSELTSVALVSYFPITFLSSPILHTVWYGWFPLYLFERPIKCREWENWLFWERTSW